MVGRAAAQLLWWPLHIVAAEYSAWWLQYVVGIVRGGLVTQRWDSYERWGNSVEEERRRRRE
eukprot:11094640-Lingulodinium_polyedra.AAC.1